MSLLGTIFGKMYGRIFGDFGSEVIPKMADPLNLYSQTSEIRLYSQVNEIDLRPTREEITMKEVKCPL
jgi:hypothetical protein